MTPPTYAIGVALQKLRAATWPVSTFGGSRTRICEQLDHFPTEPTSLVKATLDLRREFSLYKIDDNTDQVEQVLSLIDELGAAVDSYVTLPWVMQAMQATEREWAEIQRRESRKARDKATGTETLRSIQRHDGTYDWSKFPWSRMDPGGGYG